jgi:hypothetical protein
MIKSQKLQELLQRELTRKEFLQTIGLMALSVIGITSMLGNVDKILNPNPKVSQEQNGYGMSPYGR